MSETTLPDLKPCPFCGRENNKAYLDLQFGCQSVICSDCKSEGPLASTALEAIYLWNRRPAEDARQWQPMETAPRDVTPVLLFDHVCQMQRVAVWVDDYHMWFTDWGRGGYWDSDFSHWMPLPDPPQPEAAP